MIDPIQRCLSYEMLDNTSGFKSYVATIKVLPINGDGKIGCKIEWSFVVDPINGKTLEIWLLLLIVSSSWQRRWNLLFFHQGQFD
ncbi:hypothetical protein Ddye_007811 [Dipteronia dyeriana]|uniref:Bet v I/Major latex protein domain-containing protein n=1 Tax=Dipteronia dyeriana TaxID=168575 RepID=A0AAD9XL28_9ROSI|nr:hypothetical protein Ddye_007811 [Dipteronia dyeriana]